MRCCTRQNPQRNKVMSHIEVDTPYWTMGVLPVFKQEGFSCFKKMKRLYWELVSCFGIKLTICIYSGLILGAKRLKIKTYFLILMLLCLWWQSERKDVKVVLGPKATHFKTNKKVRGWNVFGEWHGFQSFHAFNLNHSGPLPIISVKSYFWVGLMSLNGLTTFRTLFEEKTMRVMRIGGQISSRQVDQCLFSIWSMRFSSILGPKADVEVTDAQIAELSVSKLRWWLFFLTETYYPVMTNG